MEKIKQIPEENNPENLGNTNCQRKIGIEIVRSANLSTKYFRRWRAVSHPISDSSDLWSRRLAQVLR